MSETEQLTLLEGIRTALADRLAANEDVVILGEDVGKNGGVFRATDDLYEEFGDDRVIDTPLAESGIIGTSIGMAAFGLQPVPEIQFMGFSYPAFDQLINHAARLRNRSDGRFTCPMTMRTPYGGGIRAPEHHSESTEAFYAHQPGLKVVTPATPADAKGLLTTAIEHPDPVIFLEPTRLYRAVRGPVPTDTHTVELESARIHREGEDLTAITWGALTQTTLSVAEDLAGDIDVEVVDLRTLAPFDIETIVESFKKTGRAVVVHEAPKTGGLGGEIIATLQEEALGYQQAPINRVTGYDVPIPLPAQEMLYLPGEARIQAGIEEVAHF